MSRMRERPGVCVTAEELEEIRRLLVSDIVPASNLIGREFGIQIFVSAFWNRCRVRARVAASQHRVHLRQTNLVVRKVVAFLTGEQFVDEIDDSDRFVQTEGVGVLRVSRVPIAVHVEHAQKVLTAGGSKRQNVRGQAREELHLPTLKLQRLRARIRKKARPNMPRVRDKTLWIDGVW